MFVFVNAIKILTVATFAACLLYVIIWCFAAVSCLGKDSTDEGKDNVDEGKDNVDEEIGNK